MTLHIFNPEHDIALASGLANFTAPHAGRQLRYDLGFLPALWAGEDDMILVDNAEQAQRAYNKLRGRLHALGGNTAALPHRPCFHARKEPLALAGNDRIVPWGWDDALAAMLHRRGVDASLLPLPATLGTIRQLSHRRTAALLLPRLQQSGTTGESTECTTMGQCQHQAEQVYGQAVLKAPWSSSGRGLRFVDASETAIAGSPVEGWLRNLLERQGSVMVEPYYNKVKDFGMEFRADETGHVGYEGMSLFQTVNGAYEGNILATEAAKEALIGRYLPPELLHSMRDRICKELQPLLAGKYQGPLGVDMMVVAGPDGKGFRLHPCVEINLRQTMGHVALHLERLLNPQADDDRRHVMRIVCDNNCYKLKIRQL